MKPADADDEAEAAEHGGPAADAHELAQPGLRSRSTDGGRVARVGGGAAGRAAPASAGRGRGRDARPVADGSIGAVAGWIGGGVGGVA